MKKTFFIILSVCCVASSLAAQQTASAADKGKPIEQVEIRLVEKMPSMPHPYKIKDWKKIAVEQDRLLYDFSAKGQLYPLGWWDDSNYNFNGKAFGIVSYVGQNRNRKATYAYESLPVMGSIIGATLAGIDKSYQNGIDYVSMVRQFYNKRNGLDLILNSPNRSRTGESFWYEIFPGMAFNMICDLYPDNEELSRLMLSNASQWIQAINGLKDRTGVPDFDCTGYDFKAAAAKSNGRWKEPDAAAGLAWLEFGAYVRSGRKEYLEAVKDCMAFMERRPAEEGIYYEIMMPYGAYLAVRMNAEHGTDYDEMKYLDWCFDGNNSDRDGWGVVADNWNGYDVSGLVGQKKYEGYAFAMNSFSQIAALLPIVKYNPAYSHTIAKWVLNAVNAARLFYADEHPLTRQSSALWKGDPEHAICYEGLRSNLKGNHFEPFIGILDEKGPYAIGDHVKFFTSTDICPYGSAWSGILAGIVKETDVDGILQLDCNVTDYFGDRTNPQYLIYNPHPERKTAAVMLPEGIFDIFDRVSGKRIAEKVSETFSLDFLPEQTYNIVCVRTEKQSRPNKGISKRK